MDAPTEIDCYRVLGLTQTATAAEIKRAYRKKLLSTHPDKNPGMSSDEFCKVQEAFETLQNGETRSLFDRNYEDIREQWDMYARGETRGRKEKKTPDSPRFAQASPAPEKHFPGRRTSPAPTFRAYSPSPGVSPQPRRSHSRPARRAKPRSPSLKPCDSYKSHRPSKSDSPAQTRQASPKRHAYSKSVPSYNYKIIRPRWATEDDIHIPVIPPKSHRCAGPTDYEDAHQPSPRSPRTPARVNPSTFYAEPYPDDPGYYYQQRTVTAVLIEPGSRYKAYKTISPVTVVERRRVVDRYHASPASYHTVAMQPSHSSVYEPQLDYPILGGPSRQLGSVVDSRYDPTRRMQRFNSNVF
ncbi:hypothetical protein ACJ72_05365 [Emergomyces africanus]|uniref:J domain-containing protein n=1 Tax=Emergomyces africanus TaxID=1955775 RepID=A0A1B7NU68_9EURO|nr:hypothetical protein ACJ72_05365 [Emergomyces africanus]